MKIYFSNIDKMNEIQFEDILFIGNYIEGQGVIYKMVGKAIINDEIYNDFVIEFTLQEEPKKTCLKDILNAEWLYYDYIFS